MKVYDKSISFHFGLPSLSFTGKCVTNGLAEFVDQCAVAITTIVFNRVAFRYAGENGIAAVTIIMYLQFIFIGIYFGYSMGISPLLSYAFGNHQFLKCHTIESISLRFISLLSILIYPLTYLTAPIAVKFFASPDSPVYQLTIHGMRIYCMGFIVSGFNIFFSIRFTSYGLGHYAGIITLLRSFLLLILFLFLFSSLWGINGLWLAVPTAECITFIFSLFLVKKVSCFKPISLP